MKAGVPDFVIVGAMKAGTTTLFDWLGEHPDVILPEVKEPEILLRSADVASLLSAYTDLLPKVVVGQASGEASAAYADPEWVGDVMSRLRSIAPHAVVIYIVREPEQRLRSHIRHEILRGRERRSFGAALREPGSRYVSRSRYSLCLAPMMAASVPSTLLVVSFDQLFGDEESEWFRILDALGLSRIARPVGLSNASDERPAYRWLMLWLFDRGLHRRCGRTPLWLRRLVKPMLIDSSSETNSRIRHAAQDAPLPPEVDATLRLDWSAATEMIGSWEREGRRPGP